MRSFTKQFNALILFVTALIMLTGFTFANLCIATPYEDCVNRLKDRLQCTQRTAEDLFLKINYLADGIQEKLVYVASSTDSTSSKEEMIDEIIQEYFTSENSTIQVSSLRRTSIYDYTITDYTIDDYLHRLANLKDELGYAKVDLMFEPSYLGIGAVEKTDDFSYEISISMWQSFVGWIEDSIGYDDATRKKFRLSFDLKDNKISNIRIDEIAVAETIELERFKRRLKNERE
jgi:hypothetical protein